MSLENLKAREAEIRQQIADGMLVIEVGASFTLQQLGLQFVYADAKGRLWRIEGSKMIRIVL